MAATEITEEVSSQMHNNKRNFTTRDTGMTGDNVNSEETDNNTSGSVVRNELNAIQLSTHKTSIPAKSRIEKISSIQNEASINNISHVSNANNSSLTVNVQPVATLHHEETVAQTSVISSVDILHAEEKQPPVFYTSEKVVCGPLLRLCHSSLLRRGVYVSHHQRHRLLYHPELLRESHYNLSPFRHCAFLPYLPQPVQVETRESTDGMNNRHGNKRINTLVLDLDETLLHCSLQYMPDADAVMTVDDMEVNNNNSSINKNNNNTFDTNEENISHNINNNENEQKQQQHQHHHNKHIDPHSLHLPSLSLLSFTTTTTTNTTNTARTTSSSAHKHSRKNKHSALVAACSGPNVSESLNARELADGTESATHTKTDTLRTNSVTASTETVLSIKYRPHLHSFLRFCLEHFEVVLFTAAEPTYVKVVIDALQRDFADITFTFADNYNLLPHSANNNNNNNNNNGGGAAANRNDAERVENILNTSHEPVEYPFDTCPKCGVITVLHRDYCTPTNAGYTKDLYLLGRDLRHVILLDNSAFNSIFQPFNCVQVKDYKRLRRLDEHASHRNESKESYDTSDTMPSAKKVSKVIKSSHANDKYNVPAVVSDKSVDLSYSIVDWVDEEDDVLGELMRSNGLLSHLAECNNVLHYITRMYLYNRRRCKSTK